MEDGGGRRSFQSGSGERRMEIVSGRGNYHYNFNQVHTANRSRTFDLPTVHKAGSRRKEALKPWGFGDAEMKRRKRIAKYKVYSVEGRVKASIRNGFRWIKNKCSEIIHGY